MRERLAEQWGVPPWEVDAAPPYYRACTLKINQLEAECQPKEQKKG